MKNKMSILEEKIINVLQEDLDEIVARSVLDLGLSRSRVEINYLEPGDDLRLMNELAKGIRLYQRNSEKQADTLDRLSDLLAIENLITSADRHGIAVP